MLNVGGVLLNSYGDGFVVGRVSSRGEFLRKSEDTRWGSGPTSVVLHFGNTPWGCDPDSCARFVSGATPQTRFSQAEWKKPAKDAKIIPFPIERVRFRETRTVAFRLKQAA